MCSTIITLNIALHHLSFCFPPSDGSAYFSSLSLNSKSLILGTIFVVALGLSSLFTFGLLISAFHLYIHIYFILCTVSEAVETNSSCSVYDLEQ